MKSKLKIIIILLNLINCISSLDPYYEILNRIKREHIDEPPNQHVIEKREVDTTFHGKPKTREEMWHHNFNTELLSSSLREADLLVKLLNKIVTQYLGACVPIVIYDKYVESSDSVILQTFFKKFKLAYIHGRINDNYTVVNQNLLNPIDNSCRSYILFLSDVLRTKEVLGPQTMNRVIIIPRSTQWKQQEFLSSKLSSDIINLLVIGESLSVDPQKAHPYVLYTHDLYTDGLGSNTPIVLTSWIKGKLSRPHVNLFPKKFIRGFAGHRFTISAVHQPPYVIKALSTDDSGSINIKWDGLEFRILKLLSKRLNFTYDVVEPKRTNLMGPTYKVIDDITGRRADFGLAGAYVTQERLNLAEMSVQHSKDCAAFITLASKALPRYRAILGPFQWPVWIAITATYLLAIFPLAFSDRLTLRHLIGNWSEIENMFWYVFGTFTNSLTFTGQYSWSSTKRGSTRILIGWYWVFTIIITACYTSSIIAFVTLPVFPETVDTISDLLWGFFRIGTLENDGWQNWFLNSSHAETTKLIKNLELVANVEEGLSNVTKAFFWPYAFLGSRTQLEFIVQANFSDENIGKRSALHIGEECLSIFGISYLFPKNSVYTDSINNAVLKFQEAGLIAKLNNDLFWDIQKLSKGSLLKSQSSKQLKSTEVEERGLTLADTEGMFLLMGIGYIIAGSVLVSEMIGGCANKCKQIARRASTTISRRTSVASSIHPNSSRKTSISTTNGDAPKPLAITWESSTESQVRFRRRSEQITKRGSVSSFRNLFNNKQRHNSLVSGMIEKTVVRPNSSNLPTNRTSLNGFDEESLIIDDAFGFINGKDQEIVHHTTVEINRQPSPSFDHIDDNFGEKIYHLIEKD